MSELATARLTHYVRETINVGTEMTFAKTIERHLIVLIVKRFCHVHGPYRVQDDETDFRFFAKAAEMIFAHLVASPRGAVTRMYHPSNQR